ncbi:MAG: aromatic amino acid lyase, partial [Pseudomonadota bacterium]
MSALVLTPGDVSLVELKQVYTTNRPVELNRSCKDAVDHAAARIAAVADGDTAVYGVNTGFGKLASHKIAPEDTAHLQRNLILSHCCGVGDRITTAQARLI